MPSQRQLAANKMNAQKSTGPKTPEGRAAVRLNGVKHGLTASTLILPGENESDFNALLSSFETEHQPATPTEEALVRQMAMAQWRLRRLYHVEGAFLNQRLSQYDEEPTDEYENLDHFGRVAYVVDRSDGMLINLSRFEARLERSFSMALRELQKLKKQSQSQNRTPLAEPQDSPTTQELPKSLHLVPKPEREIPMITDEKSQPRPGLEPPVSAPGKREPDSRADDPMTSR